MADDDKPTGGEGAEITGRRNAGGGDAPVDQPFASGSGRDTVAGAGGPATPERRKSAPDPDDTTDINAED